MTEHTAIADLGRLAASGRVPSPEVLARRARRWGWWFYVEGWLRGSKAWAVSLLVYMVLMPLLYLFAGRNPLRNRFEIEAGLEDGNYLPRGIR